MKRLTDKIKPVFTIKKVFRGRVISIKFGDFKFIPNRKRKHYEYGPKDKKERSFKFMFKIPF